MKPLCPPFRRTRSWSGSADCGRSRLPSARPGGETSVRTQAEPLVLLPCASGGVVLGRALQRCGRRPVQPGGAARVRTRPRAWSLGAGPLRAPPSPPCGRPAGWAEGGARSRWLPSRLRGHAARRTCVDCASVAPVPCLSGRPGSVRGRAAAPCSASRGGGSFDHSREFEFVRSFLRVWLLSRAPAAPGPGRAPRDARGDENTLKISLETRRKTLSDFRLGDVPTWSGAERACVRGHLWGWGRGSTLVSEKGTLFQRRQLQG